MNDCAVTSSLQSWQAEMFLGLIFKALKSDVDVRRMSAIAKRLTQVGNCLAANDIGILSLYLVFLLDQVSSGSALLSVVRSG